VPIVAGDEVLCVLVFFMGDARDEDSRLVELVSAIGSHLKLTIKHKQADFIERAQAEAALREQSQLTQTITNNATTAIFMEDSQARRIFMNPPAEAMTGYTFGNCRFSTTGSFTPAPMAGPFPFRNVSSTKPSSNTRRSAATPTCSCGRTARSSPSGAVPVPFSRTGG
jgi:predicted aminopeptidase